MAHFFDDAPGATTSQKPGQAPGQPPGEFDALADLFLGDDDAPTLRLTSEAPRRAPSPSPAPPKKPAQITGPAPVEALILGHLPVLAGAWAAQHARCCAEESGIPVALARFTSDSASLQLIGPRDALEGVEESDSIDEAARAASNAAGAWCVRVEAPSEPDLAASSRVTRVTLLSGADEAAVVAAYRTLKGLCDASPDDAPTFAVRIMGASDADAQEAEQKIRRVAKAFLDRDLEFLPSSQQIHAGSGATLYRGPHEDGYESLLAAIAAQPAAAAPTRDDLSPVTEPPTTTLAERADLTPLTLRCPAAPAIEFACDREGRLHLLGLGAASAEDLLAAEGWARTNAGVVLTAAKLDENAEIIVRVLTSTPARDRRLLDGRFRVDLLHEVRVGEESAWCCVALNSDD